MDEITLANVLTKPRQEVFDFIVGQLLAQNCKSMGPTGCAYRGFDGMKCAVGHIIADSEYSRDMENVPSSRLVKTFHQDRLLEVEEYAMIDLLKDMQGIHDSYLPSTWKARFKHLTCKYDLEWNHG